MNDILEKCIGALVKTEALERYEAKTGIKVDNFTDFYNRISTHLASTEALEEEVGSNNYIKYIYKRLGDKITFLKEKYPDNRQISFLEEVKKGIGDYAISKVKIEEYYRDELHSINLSYAALVEAYAALYEKKNKK